ncbi:hypothetical protein FACS1894190_05210 [Spirochaetia bacterium]|nr:hypothetical protein FACS1894190_05210 [Spirochaetia bacterium]
MTTLPGTPLLRLLPPVTRARNFRLYLADGTRLVDLWQCGGAAILGHKNSNVLRDLKNAGERGLFAPFPHFEEKRLLKALAALFPNKCFRIFSDKKSCENAIETANTRLNSAGGNVLKIPAEPWLPFSGFDENQVVFRAVLPFPLAPVVLVLDKSVDNALTCSDLPPPVLTAATSRAIYNLLSNPQRGIMHFESIKRAFNDENLKKPWKLQGIYIKPAFIADAERWAAIFKTFLAAGYLLPPDTASPLILPAELSGGEEKTLVSLLNHTLS